MRLMVRFVMFLILFAAVAQAQMSEKITVNYVEIPVTVVDRDGAPIRGLKAENFQVVSEGKPRSVQSVDVVDFGADQAGNQSVNATSPLNPIARRNFLIVFDLSYSAPFRVVRAQAAARNFVTKMVHPRDRVGVATIDVARGFRLLSAFTTDRTLVNKAIADPQSFRGFDPLQLAGGNPTEALSDLQEMPGSADEGAQNLKEILQGANRLEDDYNRQKIDRQVTMLAGLSTTLRAVSGRKHIVFLSEGFDPRLIQGRDARSTPEQLGESAAAEAGHIWQIDNNNRYGSSSSMSLLATLTDAARKADVVLDAIDITGVRTESDARKGLAPTSNEGLHLLANATGGVVIKNSNDLSADFAHELKMQEVVYVLGFQVPTTQPGSFHAIKVKLVDVPGGHLSQRAGYYEKGVANDVERSMSNAEVVMNDIPQDAIHVSALAAPFPTSKANDQVPVILEIDGKDLLASARNGVATTDVFIYAFDNAGLVRDSFYQRIQLDLAKVGERLRSNGMKYYATLSLPPGSYAIKSLVTVHESGSRGFRRSDVVVPEARDLAVSQPFFFESPGQWLMIKGGSHDTSNASYPFQVNGEAFIPSAAVHLRAGGPGKFVLFVRNASPDELAVETLPKSHLLSILKNSEGTKLVLELQDPGKASALNVSVRKLGNAAQQTTTIPLVND
jgi:VWFA-related protein